MIEVAINEAELAILDTEAQARAVRQKLADAGVPLAPTFSATDNPKVLRGTLEWARRHHDYTLWFRWYPPKNEDAHAR